MADCGPNRHFQTVEIPNCNDPVFRAWCDACQLSPGHTYSARDARIAQLEAFMQGMDPTYDPDQDTADDYLTPRGF